MESISESFHAVYCIGITIIYHISIYRSPLKRTFLFAYTIFTMLKHGAIPNLNELPRGRAYQNNSS